jgi:serine/threonine protein kinase
VYQDTRNCYLLCLQAKGRELELPALFTSSASKRHSRRTSSAPLVQRVSTQEDYEANWSPSVSVPVALSQAEEELQGDDWEDFMAAVSSQSTSSSAAPAKAYGLAAVPPRETIASTPARTVQLRAVSPHPETGAARSKVAPIEPSAGPGTVFYEYLACSNGPAYRFVRKLADSLMGSVWKAVRCTHDEATNELVDLVPEQAVVIKRSFYRLVMSKRDRDGRPVREDPLHEVRVLHYLSGKHSNVVNLLGAYTDSRPTEHGFDESGREMFVVLEYCAGGDLFDHITVTEGRPENRFSEAKIRAIFTDICSAVIAMHGWGIVHRDLSPENILLTADGRAKLCDPGQAADKWANGPHPFPPAEDVLGKNHFRAPELGEVREHDEKADVYSLGMILFLLFFLGMRPPSPSKIARGGLFEDVVHYGRMEWAPKPARTLMYMMTLYDPSKRLSMLDVFSSEWMAPSAAYLGFPTQQAMVSAAAGNIAAGDKVCRGLYKMRVDAARAASASTSAPTAATASSSSSSSSGATSQVSRGVSVGSVSSPQTPTERTVRGDGASSSSARQSSSGLKTSGAALGVGMDLGLVHELE